MEIKRNWGPGTLIFAKSTKQDCIALATIVGKNSTTELYDIHVFRFRTDGKIESEFCTAKEHHLISWEEHDGYKFYE